MHTTMVPVQVKIMKIQAGDKFQDKENSEDIFSFGSAMEDFICVVFVPDRNIEIGEDTHHVPFISLSHQFSKVFAQFCAGGPKDMSST
ncbi:hypothetical protein Tco_1173718 [Tanacetum coccineum]